MTYWRASGWFSCNLARRDESFSAAAIRASMLLSAGHQLNGLMRMLSPNASFSRLQRAESGFIQGAAVANVPWTSVTTIFGPMGSPKGNFSYPLQVLSFQYHTARLLPMRFWVRRYAR